jgi:hypothetical protein
MIEFGIGKPGPGMARTINPGQDGAGDPYARLIEQGECCGNHPARPLPPPEAPPQKIKTKRRFTRQRNC